MLREWSEILEMKQWDFGFWQIPTDCREEINANKKSHTYVPHTRCKKKLRLTRERSPHLHIFPTKWTAHLLLILFMARNLSQTCRSPGRWTKHLEFKAVARFRRDPRWRNRPYFHRWLLLLSFSLSSSPCASRERKLPSAWKHTRNIISIYLAVMNNLVFEANASNPNRSAWPRLDGSCLWKRHKWRRKRKD